MAWTDACDQDHQETFAVGIAHIADWIFKYFRKAPISSGLFSLVYSRSLMMVLLRVPSSFSFLITVHRGASSTKQPRDRLHRSYRRERDSSLRPPRSLHLSTRRSSMPGLSASCSQISNVGLDIRSGTSWTGAFLVWRVEGRWEPEAPM